MCSWEKRSSKMRLLILCFALLLSFAPVQNASLLDYFGSKTPYSHADKRAKERSRSADAESDLHDCVAESVFMVVRHGSRWPTAKQLGRFEKLRSIFANFTHTFRPLDEGLLTVIGEDEMRRLGSRTREAFSAIFDKHPEYHPNLYDFKASQSSRALQSAHSFAAGMFGHSRAFAIQSDSMDKDYLLRFHDNCPSYVSNKKLSTPILRRFVDKVVQRIRNRFKSQDSFDHKALDSLWTACLFESTALNQQDNACRYFDLEDARVMEYIKDVEDYWEKSHGQALNYEMACLLVKDAMTSLLSRKNRFLFGHAETIIPLVSFLGLFKDPIHLGVDIDTEEQRKWRSGNVSPFGANVAFVLKTCASNASQTLTRAAYVEIRHNEQVLDLSHLCPVSGSPRMSYSCTLEGFQAILEKRLEACDFHSMCNT